VDKTEGVLRTERVRVRRAGQRYFVDVTISVPRTAVSSRHTPPVNRRETHRPDRPADVVVHVEPRARQNEHPSKPFAPSPATRPRHSRNIGESLRRHLFIELHLEVEEGSSLREAHRRATELENEILQATDPGARVNIHIEPLGVRIGGAEEMKELARSVQHFLNSLQSEYHELVDCHDVRVRSADHKIWSPAIAPWTEAFRSRRFTTSPPPSKTREGKIPSNFFV